ncbi:MAG: AmmeMemoRadiSam system protein A [Clostridiales bacterium]|nr:AmmeMemoRadiSam system protein A [Clostridiales bacterium]
MGIIGAFIMPHPPLILPEVGRGEQNKIKATVEACEKVAETVAELKPETIVLTSPHSVMYADYFHVSPGDSASGDMGGFGAPGLSLGVGYDSGFARGLEARARKAGIPAGTMGERQAALDHGTFIPLYFVNKVYPSYKLVRIGLSGLSVSEHYRLGTLIAKQAEESGKKTVLLASGDLSHKLSYDGPYGFAPEGVEFDNSITRAFEDGDFMRFLTYPPGLTEKAAECGLRSFIIMAGALDGREVASKLLSYENTFGVGYAVASFIPGKDDESRQFLRIFEESEKSRLKQKQTNEYVRLAYRAINNYVKHNKAEVPSGLPEELTKRRAGVFVSIKKHGNLRGCIGTIEPVRESIAEEIVRNAVSACAHDPRFSPVTPDELDMLDVSVDVLTAPVPVKSVSELDVRKYGIIVESGYKRGVLLPDLDGIDDVAQQMEVAKRKAGISDAEDFRILRFEVVRHE